MNMNFDTLLATLKIGDVVRTTDVLECFPQYWIEGGARFVVVEKQTTDRYNKEIGVRLVPADEAKLTSGDLSEWGNILCMDEEYWSEEVEGCDGPCWLEVPVVRDNDALAVEERIAAVFTSLLAAEVGNERMALVVAQNAKLKDPQVCASHDMCDANMPMDEAYTTVVGHRIDADDEAQCEVWNKAWTLAKDRYFQCYGKPQEGEEEAFSENITGR